jgi:hypothetical protein
LHLSSESLVSSLKCNLCRYVEGLLDVGAITQAEFDKKKAGYLAAMM